jgi:thioredoxin 1
MTMSTLASVTDDTFDAEVIGATDTVIVEFWAEWCGPCRAVAPVLEAIAAEEMPGLKIVKMNSDDELQTAMKYRIMSIPTLKVFRGGEVVGTIVGAKPAAAMRHEIDRYLGQDATL